MNITFNSEAPVATVPVATGDTDVRAVVDPEDLPRVAQLRWRLHRSGQPVWHHRTTDGWETLTLARAVLGLPAYGGARIFHRNGNRLDCRRRNLTVSKAQLVRAIEASPLLSNSALAAALHADPQVAR